MPVRTQTKCEKLDSVDLSFAGTYVFVIRITVICIRHSHDALQVSLQIWLLISEEVYKTTRWNIGGPGLIQVLSDRQC